MFMDSRIPWLKLWVIKIINDDKKMPNPDYVPCTTIGILHFTL